MADGYYRDRAPEVIHLADTTKRPKVAVPTKIIVNKKFFEQLSNYNMYNNQNQYANQGYQSSYPQYQQTYNTGYGYDGYGQPQYINTTHQPVPPGEEYPQNSWAPVSGYQNAPPQPQPQLHVPPPVTTQTSFEKSEDEAVAHERKQQNAQLIRQREDYVRKARVLKRELELLRNQKHEIMSENSSQRDMELIIKENIKLQDEIQSKMKAIYNVVDMLSNVIKDGLSIADLEAQLKESPAVHHQRHSSKSHRGEGEMPDVTAKYNYMHYDPELHWCRTCDEFPKTAKDYLIHLQSDKHKSKVQEDEVGDNTPWHKLTPEPELPCYENASKKRIPIRGLQFFISAPAWYCKLCDTWIGDLHCASHHLKSQAHFQNYANFVEQNPHWEIEWLKDREKAMTRGDRHAHSSDSEELSDSKKKRRHRAKESSTSRDKKKKKRSKKKRKHSSDSSSSSSSSDSSSEEEPNDKSKSIRVVMRNMKVQSIMNEDLTGKWEMLERLVDEHKKKEESQRVPKETPKPPQEDHLINQWMTVSEPQPTEKLMLDNLKDRMKLKQDQERAKFAEIERKQREKERLEREKAEREVREEQEAKEKFEKEHRKREMEEYERIRDKDRNQVRFKASRDNYRKRRTPSVSPERARSPSEERHYSSGKRSSRDRRDSHSDRNGSESRRSPSRSSENKYQSEEQQPVKRKPPGPPPGGKRLPFIGRMPLFKNKKTEEKVEKEIKKEDYDIPRQTRFQPGNLARAFLPQPDVVCFPKLSSYPPMAAPPPPTVTPPIVAPPVPPAPPKITEDKPLTAPPAPKIGSGNSKYEETDEPEESVEGMEEENSEDNALYGDSSHMDPNMMNQYYPPGMNYNMMYNQMYGYTRGNPPAPPPPEDVPLSHTRPLQPPPLPPNDPNDDLAMLGISADDMAAQSF